MTDVPSPAWVSDAIVDLLVEAEVGHVAFNPGATFRGIHDSLVNHRPDAPPIVLCAHEEISVAIAHGWAQATGRAMAVLLHNIVGLQHASMSIYNAWCDRVPMLLLGGTGPVSTAERRPWIDWIHTALVQGELVRDYVKLDDQPADAASIPNAFARCWNTAHAAPTGPVYLCLDAGLQERPFEGEPWRPFAGHPRATDPAPRAEELTRVAEALRTARSPVLMSDYAGTTEAGFAGLVALAEATGAAVVDRGARLNFPTAHPLNATGDADALEAADVVVAIDVEDLHGALGGRRPATVAHLTPQHLKQRAWSADFQELADVDLLVTATAETALDGLARALEPRPPAPAAVAERTRRLGEATADRRAAWWAEALAADAVDSVPPSRLAAEVWPLIEGERWTLVHGRPDGWERRLWAFDRPRQHLGWHGGGGLGHGLGAAIGAALALGRDELCISMQPDGDLLFTPSALWTAARMRVPLLVIVQNNRQYGNTVGHAAELAHRRGRPRENRYVGAGLRDPDVDFAALARAQGVWATGPVSRAQELASAVGDAIAVVRTGRPALVEVLTTGA